jgi:hypothetical protein
VVADKPATDNSTGTGKTEAEDESKAPRTSGFTPLDAKATFESASKGCASATKEASPRAINTSRKEPASDG